MVDDDHKEIFLQDMIETRDILDLTIQGKKSPSYLQVGVVHCGEIATDVQKEWALLRYSRFF